MIKKIWVKGFRNLCEQVVELHPTVTIIVGENNQGKTNFLEALSVAMSGKSPARAHQDMVIGIMLAKAQLGLSLVDCGCEKKLYLDLLRDEGKRIQWNGDFVKTYRTVVDTLAVQYWSADVLWLFQESPSFRREFLDDFCGRYFDGFLAVEKRYQAILKQKNKVLELGNVDEKMLSLLNDQLADFGVKIIECRLAAIHRMMDIVTPYLATYFPNGGADINVQYSGDYAGTYRQLLSEKQSKEIMVKQSLYGPHRDDFSVKVGDMPMVGFYSRGMTRIFALLLSFAQLLLLSSQKKRVSLLLLDDAFAELDITKKQSLMSDFSQQVQVVYTTVLDEDRYLFDDSYVFEMKSGKLSLLPSLTSLSISEL